MSARTFLALDVDAAVRTRLARIVADLCIDGARVRCVAAENIHLTLNFLGDVADDMLNDVCLAVADVATAAEPLDFAIRRVRCMPPRGQPKIIWVDADNEGGQLIELQQALTDAMSALGFRPDHRKYHPHVTIARVRYARAPDALRLAIEPYADADFAAQQARHVTTYTSVLAAGGPAYTVAARAPLGA